MCDRCSRVSVSCLTVCVHVTGMCNVLLELMRRVSSSTVCSVCDVCDVCDRCLPARVNSSTVCTWSLLFVARQTYTWRKMVTCWCATISVSVSTSTVCRLPTTETHTTASNRFIPACNWFVPVEIGSRLLFAAWKEWWIGLFGWVNELDSLSCCFML